MSKRKRERRDNIITENKEKSNYNPNRQQKRKRNNPELAIKCDNWAKRAYERKEARKANKEAIANE